MKNWPASKNIRLPKGFKPPSSLNVSEEAFDRLEKDRDELLATLRMFQEWDSKTLTAPFEESFDLQTKAVAEMRRVLAKRPR